ncbi:MAG: CRISPR-associated endoribonuclease Cas6, partial [Chloroflexota bacterium]
PDDALRLRYTTLHPQLTNIFHHGILPSWEDKVIDIHGQRLRVTDILIGEDVNSWVDQADYVELVDTASTKRKISFAFTSPTAFKRTAGGFTPLPQPELVFSSLLMRWNAFAPFRLPDWLYDTVHQDIVIDTAKVQTETLAFARGYKGTVTGFTGKVTYRLLCNENKRRYLQALACFAKYSGIGVKTTVGMGQVKGVV